MSEVNKRILSKEELNCCYEKAELDLLRDALKLSYSERFTMMMTLMKVGIMMSKAKTIHKPYPSKSS